jgi:8-oxo-dGTP diphosphatase
MRSVSTSTSAAAVWARRRPARLRGGEHGVGVGVGRALQQLRPGPAGHGLGVGRRACEQPVVRLDRGGVVALRHRVLGGHQVGVGGRRRGDSGSPATGTGQSGLGRGGEHLLEERAQVALGQRTGEALHQPAADGEQHRRDALDLQLARDGLVAVDVDLGKHPRATTLGGEPLEHGGQLLARTAPVGPEVDEDGHLQRALQHVALEGRLRDVEDVRRRGRAAAPSARPGRAGARSDDRSTAPAMLMSVGRMLMPTILPAPRRRRRGGCDPAPWPSARRAPRRSTPRPPPGLHRLRPDALPRPEGRRRRGGARRAGRLLLVQRSVGPGKGLWALPAGFVDADEDPRAAAAREAREETGLRWRSGAVVDVYPTPGRGARRSSWPSRPRSSAGTLAAGDDALDAGFFALDELPELAFPEHAGRRPAPPAPTRRARRAAAPRVAPGTTRRAALDARLAAGLARAGRPCSEYTRT